MSTNDSTPAKTVGELLDDLFKQIRHPSGREFTYQEVSKGVGGELDPTYIAKFRKGKIPNPGRNAVMLLCRFFQVPPSYFFPELKSPAAEGDNDPLEAAVARRGQNSPAVQRKIDELIRALRKEVGNENDPTD